jgi:hypothetical protein
MGRVPPCVTVAKLRHAQLMQPNNPTQLKSAPPTTDGNNSDSLKKELIPQAADEPQKLHDGN